MLPKDSSKKSSSKIVRLFEKLDFGKFRWQKLWFILSCKISIDLKSWANLDNFIQKEFLLSYLIYIND